MNEPLTDVRLKEEDGSDAICGCPACNIARGQWCCHDGWRPIDTAPKDGKDIILWGPCRMDGDARSFAKDANVGWWCADHWRTRTNEICKATHWMPLPQPPSPSGV